MVKATKDLKDAWKAMIIAETKKAAETKKVADIESGEYTLNSLIVFASKKMEAGQLKTAPHLREIARAHLVYARKGLAAIIADIMSFIATMIVPPSYKLLLSGAANCIGEIAALMQALECGRLNVPNTLPVYIAEPFAPLKSSHLDFSHAELVQKKTAALIGGALRICPQIGIFAALRCQLLESLRNIAEH